MSGAVFSRRIFSSAPSAKQWLDIVSQVAILICTVGALWLLGEPGPWMRWGYLVGLAGQPFYLISTWRARQWGMFFAAFFVTGLWVRGAINHF